MSLLSPSQLWADMNGGGSGSVTRSKNDVYCTSCHGYNRKKRQNDGIRFNGLAGRYESSVCPECRPDLFSTIATPKNPSATR